MQELLFVYGSLMRGLANSDQMPVQARFIRVAATVAEYSLLDMGPYPGAVGNGRKSLKGELYAVTRGGLSVVDAFEGVPSFYRRVRVQLLPESTDDGIQPTDTAWIYLLTALPVGAREVPSGSWRQRLEQR